MEDEIEAIFFDTNVFERSKFEYKGNNLEKLLLLCEEHDIPIYIDYIVEQEVLHRISENVKKSVEGIKKEQLLYLSKLFNVSTEKKEIMSNLSKKLNDDFSQIKLDYLTILENTSSALEVAEMYFEELAPFGDGIKKHEFPDAIIATNIKNYSLENSIKILTVTHDKGLIEFFETNNLQTVNVVSQAVDIINKQFQTDSYFSNIKENLKIELIKHIKDGCIELELYSYDYQDTVYAEEYKIINVEIEDVLLIDRDNNEGILTVTCPCVLTVELETDYYPDYENGFFDKEDHNWYCFQSKKTTHRLNKEVEPTFELSEIEDDGKSLCIDYLDSSLEVEFDLYGHETTIIKETYSDESEREFLLE